MSIGISGKVANKGVELYLGKHAYTNTLTIAKIMVIVSSKLELLSLEVAVRW